MVFSFALVFAIWQGKMIGDRRIGGRDNNNNFTEVNEVWAGMFELEMTGSSSSVGSGFYFCVSFST
jgi:hypothetical protein